MIPNVHNDADEKWCGGCSRFKPLDDFHNCRTKWDGKAGWCKRCAKAGEVRRKYKMELSEYEAAMAEGCAICGDEAEHMDHCHTTGRVRAALCSRCNTGLGSFADDPKLLVCAAGYLEAHNQ